MSNKYNPEEQSVLQKIQNQTGCLLLVIGIAMLAFVLTDLVSSGSSIFSSNDNVVGVIDDEPVNYDEFNRTYEGLKLQLQQNNPGFVIDENIAKQYQNQAWNMIVESRVIEPQYEMLALTVGPAELEDLTIGDNTHPQIQQSFRDPETNQFDKQRLIRFLKEDINTNPDALQSWNSFQEQFTAGLIAQKYNTLVLSSIYVTDIEAARVDQEELQTKNATVVNLPYSEYQDSTLSVSDQEIARYIKNHPIKYEKKASRDIEFIRLDVVPSKEDSADMLFQANEIATKFAETKDDSAFVSIMNSETPYDNRFQQRGSFPASIEDDIFSANVGDIVGPYQENGTYSVYKITGEGTDSVDAVRGSHVFINVAGTDTVKAERDARQLIAQINSGVTTFEAEANKKNYDASRGKGGDMGWIKRDSKSYPKRLVKRLFNVRPNQYVVVRSKKGVHIAKATSPVSRKTVQVAVVDQQIFPSTRTDGAYYKMAGEFLSKTTGEKSFEEVAEELGLTKRVAYEISEKFLSIPGVSNPNPIAKWLFDAKTQEGDISSIIDIDGSYFIARLVQVKEKGIATVEDVRSEVEPILLNKMKAKKLVEKFNDAMSSTKNADELAQAMAIEPVVLPAASFSSANIPYVGLDQIVAGTIFGLNVGEQSSVIEGENTVAVIYLNNDNTYEATDISVTKEQITDRSKQEIQQKLRSTIEQKANISDWRYRFYN